jgi:hypothetical protein
MHLSSVADSMPPHRGTVFKQRPHRFGRGCWVGGDASIQRGGFYAAAPWHGIQATPSPVRALLWAGHVWGDRYWSEILVGEPPPGEVVGGDTFFQRGGFYAAAPWHIFQATPPAQQKVVPVSGAVVGWGGG